MDLSLLKKKKEVAYLLFSGTLQVLPSLRSFQITGIDSKFFGVNFIRWNPFDNI